jgi:hypothetical protein
MAIGGEHIPVRAGWVLLRRGGFIIPDDFLLADTYRSRAIRAIFKPMDRQTNGLCEGNAAGSEKQKL